MKHIHTLKARWLLLAMLLVTVIGETLAWQLARTFHFRFNAVPIAAVCIGLTAAVVAFVYDGRD
ncbi:MAG: hypothetical protein HZA93_09280 [Verrucomicrobia bacterium]|nr:hypothetical protein [Verrucomicrobiota bacterium]